MNCEQTLRKLWLYLDRELDEMSAGEFARHLDECRQCYSRAESERLLRAIIRRSCDGERVPPALLARLAKLVRTF